MARWIDVDFFSQQTVAMSEELVGIKIHNSNRFVSLLFRLLIAQIRKSDDCIPAVCVTAPDVAAFMQVTPSRATMGLKELLKQQSTEDVPFIIYDDSYNIEMKNLFEYVTEIDHGIYEIQINQDLTPLLCNLQRRFLSYPLMNCMMIKSPNILSLYEVLLHKKNKCEGKKLFFQIDVPELRKILDVEEKYKTFAQLKTVVVRLINAFKELGEIVELDVFRKAKKAIAVTFRFVTKASQKYVNNKEDVETHVEDDNVQVFRSMLLKHNAMIYFTKKQIKRMAEELDCQKKRKVIEEVLERVLDQNDHSKIRNLAKYFYKSVKNEFKIGQRDENSYSGLTNDRKLLYEELDRIDNEWLMGDT